MKDNKNNKRNKGKKSEVIEIMIVEKPIIIEQKVETISFDAWWSMRTKLIPKNHTKEVIMVDFKARGLKLLETIENFDAALVKYGIKV